MMLTFKEQRKIVTDSSLFFSSPEHKVLKESYSDGPVSIVCSVYVSSTISSNDISS